jgi:CubicO group peptidase (beta-lactamase class C family)
MNPFGRARRPPGVTLANWDLGGEPSAWAYLHTSDLLPTVEIPVSRPVATMASAERAEIGQFQVEPGVSLDKYVAGAPVSGIVVVQGGSIVFERYPRMEPGNRHLLMSVTKVVPSVMIGLLELGGALDLAQPVDAVIAELAGSGWAGVPIADVLGMASGIDCLEIDSPGAYTDPEHPYYRLEACLGWRPAAGAVPSAYDFVAGLPSHRPPGQVYEYTGANTFVLSWLVERVTGLPFAEVLGQQIWSKAGFDAPALLCCSADGAPASQGGLCLTLRDLARFGMLFTPSGSLIADDVIISAEHVRRIQAGGRPSLHHDRDRTGRPGYMTAAYGSRLPPASRQWNYAHEDGDLFKGGFGGQGLYVSPARDLVIAFAGIPGADGVPNLLRWYSRRLALTLG